MKSWILIASLFTGFVAGNGSLREAWSHYQGDDYQRSIASYLEALRHYPEESTRIYYNLGLCFLRIDSLGQAVNFFQRSAGGNDRGTASLASNQMGVIMAGLLRNKDALGHFRRALIQDPGNEVARYNYEMLKRRIGDQDNSDPFDDPEGDDESKNPLSDKELEEILREITQGVYSVGGQDLLAPSSLDSLPLPVAKRLLEERRKAETQFIQQLKKAPVKLKNKDKNPDW